MKLMLPSLGKNFLMAIHFVMRVAKHYNACKMCTRMHLIIYESYIILLHPAMYIHGAVRKGKININLSMRLVTTSH